MRVAGDEGAFDMKENSTASTTLYFISRYRKSPFFEATRRAGCKAYGVYNHMYIPKYYDEPVTEYCSYPSATRWNTP